MKWNSHGITRLIFCNYSGHKICILILYRSLYHQLLLFATAATLSTAIKAQSEKAYTREYSVKEGLSDQYVQQIFQDSRGFLWVSTFNGLNRFDGRDFINYGAGEGLLNRQAGKAFEDNQKRFWIAAGGNIYQFQNNRFYSYPFSDSVSNTGYVHDLLPLKNGQIIALTKSGCYSFNGNQWDKKTLLPGYEKRLCIQVIETLGNTYYNFQNAIVAKSVGNNITELWSHQPAGVFYFNKMLCRNDTLYIAATDGLYRLTSDQKRELLFRHCMPGGGWINFFIDSQKRFWIHRIGTQTIYVTLPGNTESFSDSVHINASLVSAFLEDKDHIVWAGTEQGLLKIQFQHNLHFAKTNNKLINGLRYILQTPDSAVYVFSRENGILHFKNNDFNRSVFQFTPPGTGPDFDFPDSHFMDDQKRLWMATRRRRLFRLENNRIINCSSLLPDIRDLFWIGRNPATQKVFVSLDTLKTANDSSFVFFIPQNRKDIISRPRNISAFSNGKTFVNCEEEGVLLIDEKNNVFNINEQLGFGRAALQAYFKEDPAGGLWIYGGSFGLKHFNWDKNGFPVKDLDISKDNGLPSEIISSISFDTQQRIWAVTTKGLVIIELNKKDKTVQVTQLSDFSDISIEDPGNARLMTGMNGMIWLTDRNDIYKIDPIKIVSAPRNPETAFEEIQINFKNTNWEKYTRSFTGYWHFPEGPVLNHYENNLQISFTGISFITSSDLFYSYKLDGLDTAWSKPSLNNRVTLANLKPGHYTFSVKAKTINSGWGEPSAFSFTIKPPFWDTWWFRGIVIGLAAFAIVLLYRSRIKKIKQQVQIKNQLNELEMIALKAQMNPHFIYNALNSIQSLVANNKKDEAIHYIGTFSRLLRQVLEQSDNNVITLEKELQTLELYISLEALRMNMQPDYLVIFGNNIRADAEKIPPLTLQPFVENALWHGLNKKEGAKSIEINVSATDEWLMIVIKDNGIGREKAMALKSSDIAPHQSKAIEITSKRLTDFNHDKKMAAVEVEDLYNTDGNPGGTAIKLHITRKG